MSALDDVARALAAPMSRRRALHIAGAALLAAAVPGRGTAARTVRSRTAGCGKGGGGLSCTKQFGPQISECCGPIDRSDPDSNYTCCPPGECWHTGSGRTSTTTCCPVAFRCGTSCCSEGEQCVDGTCTRCADEHVCGATCCEPGTVCANPATGLCCVKTWKQCTVGLAGVARCCVPGDSCCFNRATGTAVCCDPQHPCVDGRCSCKKGERRCGATCCKPGQECANGRCCPKGQVNCGGRCCVKDDCCGDVCCGADSVCVGGTCCTGDRLIGTGASARCCPAGTVSGSGPNRGTCCPEGDPDCCRDGNERLRCRSGSTCVNGTCRTL